MDDDEDEDDKEDDEDDCLPINEEGLCIEGELEIGEVSNEVGVSRGKGI